MLTAGRRPRRRAALGVAFSVAFPLGLGALGHAAHAQDEETEGGLVRPERLTVGVADDLLGQLSKDGGTLYFVTNRNTTSQIYAQNVADGRAHLLFDDDADVTWPRVSPDGKHLLYVSFGEKAFGQLCVRDLPGGEGKRCLEEPGAALQAEWIDRDRLALVSRQSIQGDLAVLEVSGGSHGTLAPRPLLRRNLTSPAVSPDGRFLVYVPVSRSSTSVGPAFASHAAAQLEVAVLGAGGSDPTPLPIDLPGLTGQPAFARDGRSLYVVQFFTDSNHDGVVDASDHGVLFRVPLQIEKGTLAAGQPEQLTDTSWNCEYPAPGEKRLVATCSQDKSLDVYALPLGGDVPDDWTLARLDEEIETATSRGVQQLLASRRLAKETSPSARRLAMVTLAMLHLELEEFRAAEFYAEHVAALHDHETAFVAHLLLALVVHRRALRNRDLGRLVGEFGKQAREQLAQLVPSKTASPMAVAFTHVVRSEIEDSIGQKTEAREELEAATATLSGSSPAPIVEAYYEQADTLYRELDDRDALASVSRRLANDPALSPDQRLRYAEATVRALTRGLARGDAEARLAEERPGAAEGSELAFAVDLALSLARIDRPNPEAAATSPLMALYAANPRPGRRERLVLEAVKKASAVRAQALVVGLSEQNIHDVAKGARGRADAERLFRRVLTDRAYQRAAVKKFEEARADFDAIVRETSSYEAVVGAIDMRLKLQETPEAIEATYAAGGPATPLARFAKAYVLARQLPKLSPEAAASATTLALATLRDSWADLKGKRVAQALDGALLHEEYTRTGDLALAEKANVHYLIALELVSSNPRFRSMILGQLGILHTQVGNYRIALGYLDDRDTLPYVDNAEGLSVHLAKARALLHVGRDEDAATAADEALAMVERNPQMAPYRVLALDRAAVANLAAKRFARALGLYDLEIPLLDAVKYPADPVPEKVAPAAPRSPSAIARRNQFVARLARAGAAVGAGQPARALEDLDYVDHDLDDAHEGLDLVWSHASLEDVVRSYRLITAGLRAKADAQLGKFDAEAQATRTRQAILAERFTETTRPEFERAAMLAEAQLALNASARHDTKGVSSWLTSALAHADGLRAQANGALDKEQLDVLWLSADLTVTLGATLVPGLRGRLEAASAALAEKRLPALQTYQRWFEIYLPIVEGGYPSPVAAVAASAR